ncbi:glycosyl hydrolase [Hallerella sp.]|uniref:glycosyl hydrolase n=1 Tax=Hallerella sp. TaxID=2815812 RepID=UPI00258743DF|nr:glycosyl hydrolase [Hallerella sp.]MCI6873018.1 glycosyl hydrolase [Hallerella sp.]
MTHKMWTALAAFSVTIGVAAGIASAASVTIDPSFTKQKVVGFGAGSVYYQNWITALGNEKQEALYDTAFTGLNLSLLRVGNWLQDTTASLKNDSIIIRAGKARLGDKMKVLMSSWSAPAYLKPSGSVNGSDADGDSLKATLKTSNSDKYGSYAYGDFAHWWKVSYQRYAAAGIAPDYISFQNEPDMFATYEETLFAPSETSRRAGYAEALIAIYDSLSTLPNAPTIVGPEPLGIGYNNFQGYMNVLDETKLGGYAYHLYHAGDGHDNSLNNYKNPENFRSPMTKIASSYGSDTKPIIMTEFCSMEENGVESYMVGLAHIMQVGFTDGKLNGYIAWELFWGEGKGQLIGVCTNGWGNCTADEITISPEYHAMRHYSKFVNPGWKVISTASDETALKTVAFVSEDADSISLVLTNSGTTALTLDRPKVSGYGTAYAVQSKENGFKSKSITLSSCFVLPARSVTTLVLVKGATEASATTCEDETTDESNVKPVSSDTLVLVDYSETTDVSNWKSDESLTAVSYGSKVLDGTSGYAEVPLAGCAQSDCGYQHAIFALPSSVNTALQECSAIEVTMHSMADTTTYVNVGGAGGSQWVNYKYGVQGGSESWVTTTIDLASETGDANTVYGSTQLTFNSDGPGVYISKIIATGCGSSSIPVRKVDYTPIAANGISKIYDLHGRMVWTGTLSEAELSGHTLHIQNLKAGVYMIRSGSHTTTAVKR